MTSFAISAQHLARSFGETHALVDVSLDVPAGSVCALLGRNGAGKTTTVRILTTLLDADGGHAQVAGFDIATQADKVRGKIGVTGQTATMDELLTGHENLEIIGRFSHLGAAVSRQRADALLQQFDLVDAGNQLVKKYSGGMRRRLDLAASLLANPQVLFLDEPTSGLDSVSRSSMWQTIRDLVADGTTVLLTTQHLDEADQLADEVVVLAGGVIVAAGSPAELAAAAGQARIRVSLPKAETRQLRDAQAALGPGAEARGRIITVPAPDGLASLAAAVQRLAASGVEVHDVGLEHPTLDEVFTGLTRDPAEGGTPEGGTPEGGTAEAGTAEDDAREPAQPTGRLETASS
jgi:ABC-2 type transport system ATP-binding protein